MSKYLMAIDAGTGSIRSVLFDLEGHQIGAAQHEWDHKEDPRYPGSMDFDWEHNWELTKQCIREVLAKTAVDSADIAAISTTCMREGILLYDKDGSELWACANVDARANEEVISLLQSRPELEARLYATTGQSFALDAIPRLLWVKKHLPEIYAKTAAMGMFNDWLIYKLSGVLVIEPSNGSTTGFMDLKTRNWDRSIPEQLGLRTDIFPRVGEPGEIVGATTDALLSETGLKPGIPVVIGGGDAQLGCIGVGVVNPNDAAIFGGSFWQYEYNTRVPKTDSACRVRVNCHAIADVWQYEALAFKPGLVMRWFRDAFCQQEKLLAKEQGRDVYDLMNEKASAVPPGCYGMMCTFSDVMNFISWKHASPTFTNFDLDPARFNKYTFYRAILENTALVSKGHVDLVYESTGHRPDQIIFASGASKSSLWSQILADMLGIRILVPVVKESPALGAAILAGHGVGIYTDISETSKRLVQIERVYEPNAENHALYMGLYETWRRLYQKQLDISDSGITKHMWKAPGI